MNVKGHEQADQPRKNVLRQQLLIIHTKVDSKTDYNINHLMTPWNPEAVNIVRHNVRGFLFSTRSCRAIMPLDRL